MGSTATTHHSKDTSLLTGSIQKLVGVLPPLAIKSKAEYERMLRVIDRLAVLDHRNTAQERYLETLTILVESYDDKHNAVDLQGLDPLDVIKYLLQENGLSGRDLGAILGQPQLGGKILRRERELSKAHIAALCARFRVSPELFIRI